MALELYKPEEATTSRGLIGVLVMAILGYGVFSLYEFLNLPFWRDDLTGGTEELLSLRIILAMVLLVACGFGSYLLVNHARVVEFLIETEKEMGKVSWAPRHEVISSSIVVIVTVLLLAVYLGAVDYILAAFTREIPWKTLWARLLGGS
jgi:preprotein translocase SecE subunit